MAENNPFLYALTRYAAAVLAKDIEAFSALYAQDVHVFDMWGSWSLRGLPAWRDMATAWFSSLADERVVVMFDSTDATMTDDLMIGYAVLTYTAVAPDGKELRSLSNRATFAFRKTNESWKIFHEHTSAPIDHQSLQAILLRSTG